MGAAIYVHNNSHAYGKLKRNAEGSIERYKARLMVKSYTQIEALNMMRFASFRLILTIVTHLNLELYQMDVKTTFFNGELDEEIYMDQPVGFKANGKEHKVCKL